MTAPIVLTFRFGPAGNFPNHPDLPVLIYRQVGPRCDDGGERLAHWFEETWPKHRWRAAWRWGVYNFPHFHSTAHEVLGVYRGHARLRLGHDAGETREVTAGDMLVLPAGTTHQNLGSSADFQVVGGYPDGQSADLQRGDPEELGASVRRIAQVPLPAGDPLLGAAGPLVMHWRLSTKS